MRLNQFISHHSKYSRREADRLIEEGRVNIEKNKADFNTVLEVGQRVFIDGKYLKAQNQDLYTVIVYHKPKGEIVSKKDDRDRRIVYDTLGAKYAHFISVGRLDFASEGLLLLTDSKNVARQLMQSDLEREYILKIKGSVTKEMIEAMEKGLSLQNATLGAHHKSKIKAMDFAPFLKYEVTKEGTNFSRLKVSITEGKNRELRRFFAYFKREVVDLRRVRYGWIELNALPVGKIRFLNKTEYKLLHQFLSKNDKNFYVSKKYI
ncbi:pseudouridine synthase [Helicobacter sp. 13S00477-4]|uniref:pseudouridine synthase n=1 Tax=Helicobacter sp. 13S00477-4 TaxID=1905759 RepID=UPI000BA50146|nr:pseudouridine synthase [Helicobacter sp. 13S00477-4]PAF51605.1 pseudouridine synthase [Helicobacter sp. 13S00477-4]